MMSRRPSLPTLSLGFDRTLEGAGTVTRRKCDALRAGWTRMKEWLSVAQADLVLSVLNLDYPMAVIGIDPGGTTGVAEYLVKSENEKPILHDTHQWGDRNEVWKQMRELALVWRSAEVNPIFTIEQFDKRPGIADPDYSSMYIINDIERYLPGEKRVYFTPSQGKNLVKPAHRGAPDGLKRFGWYVPGMGHANDASRQVIVFLVEKLKHRPTILLGWPKRNGS